MEEQKIQTYIRMAEAMARDICEGKQEPSQDTASKMGGGISPDLYNEIKSLSTIRDDIAFHDSIRADEALRRVHRRLSPNRRKYTLLYSIAASVFLAFGLACGYYFWQKQQKAALEWAYALPGNEPASIITADKQIIKLNEQELIVSDNQLLSRTQEGKKEKLNVNLKQTQDFNKLIVPPGGEHTLSLEDGTIIRMNSKSELLFPGRFTSEKRQVRLSGEAFFHVKSNPQKPFIVLLDGISVEVTGTSFNVQAYPEENEINIALAEGRIRILQEDKVLASLQPQELFTYHKNTEEFQVGTADISASTDWMSDVFIFRNEPIENIIQKLSRWYNVSIEVDEDIRQTRYTGILSKKQSLAETLDALRLTNELDFSLYKDKKVDLWNKKKDQQ